MERVINPNAHKEAEAKLATNNGAKITLITTVGNAVIKRAIKQHDLQNLAAHLL